LAKRVRRFTAPAAVHENEHGVVPPPGRPETIEETAELVAAAGGRGIPVIVDHTMPAEVKKLVAGIKRRHKRLDILVNDVWGGDALTEFGKPFWTCNLDNGLRMLKQAIHSHIITSHYAVPLIVGSGRKGKKRPRGNYFRSDRWRRVLLPRQPFL
jgi:NAD(P)-dependent dehydrogenase (short-subunit alcohol dehydrogenase family)